MSKFLTSSGWKTIVKDSKGKCIDNGLQKALERHESRKEDDFKNRLADLKLVFQLALALSTTLKKTNYTVGIDYLSKMAGDAVKLQEKLTADMKAAAFSANEKIMLQNMVSQAASNVATAAQLNAVTFGQEVHKACVAFEKYTGPKLDDMEGGVSAADLLGPLVTLATGQIVGALMVGVTDAIAKKIVDEMANKAESIMVGKAKSIGSSKDLEKAVHTLVLGALDASTAMQSTVQRLVVTQCDEVVAGVGSGKTLSPQLTKFIEPFINVQPSAMSSLLEKRFGVPSPAKSKATQTNIYQKLVERFEVEYIKAKTPSGEKMEWVVKGVPQSVQRNAEAASKQAGKQREQEMTAAERK